MLTTCPECHLQVSDKATTCPHCGFPLKNNSARPPRSKQKRMRLPNGFGQITELRNQNLRKPFRAMVSVGWTAEGQPIRKTLKPQGYFKTYNEAYAALVEYNKNPYDLIDTCTMEDLFNRWKEDRGRKYSDSQLKVLSIAWSYSSSIYKTRVREVRVRHLKSCIINGTIIKSGQLHTAPPSMQKAMKNLYNNLFDYAVEYELTDKNYSRMFSLSNDPDIEIPETATNEHIAFTDHEMELLWQNIDKVPIVDMILIQCYSGWRPRELMELKLKDVDLENKTFSGGLKTKSGKNRLVPIHSKILPYVVRYAEYAREIGSENLFNYKSAWSKMGCTMDYRRYFYLFQEVLKTLGLNLKHRPHDCRVQFITQAKKHHVDEYALKRMVGHRINDVTESYYTKRDPEWLREEIEKIL